MLKNAAFFFLASVLALVMVPYVFAAEVGNLYQSDEGEGKFKLELKCDHQTREVELDDDFVVYDFAEIVAIGPPEVVDREFLTVNDFDGEEVSDRYYFKASFAATPRVEVYAKLGTGRLKSKFFDPFLIETEETYVDGTLVWQDTWDELDRQISGKGDYGVLYGVGAKAIIHQSGTFQLGLDFQYLYQESDDVLSLGKDSYGWYDPIFNDRYYYEEKAEIEESETQEVHLALIASKKMGSFTPYGGVKISYYKTEYDGKISWSEKYDDLAVPANSWSESGSQDFDFETTQQDYIGIFVGADYNFTENLGVNAEVRLGDEEGFATGLCWKF